MNTLPWEVTDNYIRSGHRSGGTDCKTITLSSHEGLKAIYCDFGGKRGIKSYLFNKSKGWTLSKAKAWFNNHNNYLHESLDTRNFHYDFTRIYKTFVSHFGEEEGELKFKYFVTANELDTSKKYHPLVQFHESFQWTKPLIRYLKKDKNAKYYAITCITANISMNNRPYTPEMLKGAEVSMNYRPMNLNHDHTAWLPFPRTRVEWAKFEDNELEGVARVDNRDKWLQNKLDNHEILHPSIEGRPIPPEMGGGFHFTALALLEKGKQIPGDPLTGIQPLMLNENLYESMGKLVDGEDCLTCFDKEIDEAARTDAQRAMSHFNISQDKWDMMTPQRQQDFIKKLPPRGSGLSENTLNSKKIDLKNEGGEKMIQKIEDPIPTTENHLSIKPLSDTVSRKMSDTPEKPTTEEVKTEENREDKLKIIELESSNRMLQTQVDEVNKNYRDYRRETAEKIADLELQLAKAAEKGSVVEGLEAQVGDQASKVIEAQTTIAKRDATIENMKTDYEAAETLLAKKDKLLENYRGELTEAEQKVKEAKMKQATAEANVKKMAIDKEGAERRALEAEEERNKYSEKYSEAFDLANKAVQEKNVTLKKMHVIQEENAALREQARVDGVTIERLKRDAKIQEKRASKAEKERKETLSKIGVFEKNDDGTVDVGGVKLKI